MALMERGEISEAKAKEMVEGVDYSKLPERVKGRKSKRKKAASWLPIDARGLGQFAGSMLYNLMRRF
mgnify:CR=1 FL=1